MANLHDDAAALRLALTDAIAADLDAATDARIPWTDDAPAMLADTCARVVAVHFTPDEWAARVADADALVTRALAGDKEAQRTFLLATAPRLPSSDWTDDITVTVRRRDQ